MNEDGSSENQTSKRGVVWKMIIIFLNLFAFLFIFFYVKKILVNPLLLDFGAGVTAFDALIALIELYKL